MAAAARDRRRQYNEKDPEILRQRQAAHYLKSSRRGSLNERILRSLSRSAGYLRIDPEAVFAAYRKTGNRCQSCGQLCSVDMRVRIDHCHDSNTFRGLLCDGCNKAAGFLGDSPERALQLAAYLERHLDRRLTREES